MVNKQGLWFLTLTSLILVLSVYYITMPNELLITANGNYQLDEKALNNNEEVSVSIEGTNTIDTMRAILEDERLTLTKELNAKLVNKELTIEDRNNLYEELKYIAKIESIEETITKKLKDNYKYDSFVKIEDDVVEVVINCKEHNNSLAAKIMKCVQEEFTSPMYISVSFKE